MRNMEIVKIDDTEITIKELNAIDIKALISNAGKQTMTTLDLLFGDEMPGDAVTMSCGMTIDDLEKMAPSDLYKIVEVVKKLNPFFMKMVERLTRAAEKIQTLIPPAAV